MPDIICFISCHATVELHIISKWTEERFSCLPSFFVRHVAFKWRRTFFIIAHIMKDISRRRRRQYTMRCMYENYKTIVQFMEDGRGEFFFLLESKIFNVGGSSMKINLIKSTKLTFLCSFSSWWCFRTSQVLSFLQMLEASLLCGFNKLFEKQKLRWWKSCWVAVCGRFDGYFKFKWNLSGSFDFLNVDFDSKNFFGKFSRGIPQSPLQKQFI